MLSDRESNLGRQYDPRLEYLNANIQTDKRPVKYIGISVFIFIT